MRKFSKTITVLPEHLDELNHVNNVTYVKWIQDVSAEHWNETASQQMKNDYRWVVRNHNITYYQQAVLHDHILLETYIVDHKGPLSVRSVQMTHNKTGVKLVTSETQWCLVDAKSLKALRITDEIKSLF